MSLDGLMIHQLVNELNQTLQTGKINKIQQPYDNELILTVRANRKTYKVLLSAHPQYARMQMTTIPYQNPTQPPLFCMTLRKYLDGAIIEQITQEENDRVIHLHLRSRDDIGDLHHYILSLEMMGRHSNLIFIDCDENKIVDCVKHIGPSQNTYRTLLPGATYIAPPTQNKVNPWTIDDHRLFQFLHEDDLSTEHLMMYFQGIAKDSATELSQRLSEATHKAQAWQEFFVQLQYAHPEIVTCGRKQYIVPMNYSTLQGEKETFSTYSECFDAYFGQKAEKDRVYQKLGAIESRLQHIVKKNKQKIKKLEQTLYDADKAEILRQKGELLTTYLHDVKKGSSEVEVFNYYTNEPLVIELNPAYSPNTNAQKYFQKYQKLKKSVHVVNEQIQHAKDENNYLMTVLDQLERATPMDIDVIEEELINQHYMKKKNKGKQKPKTSQPLLFRSSQGNTIYVGRNNLQNDRLTLKKAKKTDYWFHAKNIPGSHVILQCDYPTDEEVTEAAMLAAYYSKYRHSAQVPVDMIQVKHIKKPNGAKPGFVVYEGQKTVLVTPDEQIVEGLRDDK